MAPEVLWLVGGLVLVIVELMTGTFYLLIFGVAALIAAGVAYAGAPFVGQAAAAAVAAVAGSFAVRKRRLALQGQGSIEPIDVGQLATFEAWADEPGRQARVRYRGAPWDAEVAGAGPLAAGAMLEITAVAGTRLAVRPRQPG